MHEYPLTNGNCSVIGGFVYRGSVYPALTGHYFYTDFCNPAIQTLSGSPRNLVVSQVLPSGGISTPSSFGEDFFGELYIASLNSGSLYKIRDQPPTINTKTPTAGSTGVALGTAVTAVFSEAMTAATISGSSFTLQGPGGAVPATVGYNAGSFTATLTPSSALASSTTYTATVKGGASGAKDLGGNPLPADITWSFTTAAGGSGTQTFTQTFSVPGAITINDNAKASIYPISFSNVSMTGSISKVVVKLNGLTHTYPADLDVLLVGPGGQKVMLMSDAGGGTDVSGITLTFDAAASAAVPSTALTTGVYLPANYDTTTDTFPTPAPASPFSTGLTAFNGTSPNGTWNVFVRDDAGADVGKIASGVTLAITTGSIGDNTPPTINTKTPTAGSTGVALGATVTAAFSEAMTAATISGSSFTLQGPGGAVPATVGYNAGSFTATLTPSSALASSTTYTATVKGGASGAKDLGGNPLPADFTWSFTTVAGRSGTQTFTQTFSPPGAITINDNAKASIYPISFSNVSMTGSISKVVVKLNGLTHTYPADLDVLLVGPGGRRSC